MFTRALSGGAIVVDSDSSLTVTATDFIRNGERFGVGGAIVNYGQLRGEEVVFRRNGILVSPGGALLNFGRVNLSNVEFSSHYADSFGGAVLNYGNLAIDSGQFNFNTVYEINTSFGQGGAIASLGGTVHLSNTSFVGNQAEGQGGAIHLKDAELYGNNLQFGNASFGNIAAEEFQHDAVTDSLGGAIHVEGNSRLVLNDTAFVNNLSAGAGAALAITSDDPLNAPEVRLRDVVFTMNSASLTNPAFYSIRSPRVLIQSDDYSLDVDRFDGGAIFLEAGELVVLDSVFSDNFTLGEGEDIFNEGGQLTVR